MKRSAASSKFSRLLPGLLLGLPLALSAPSLAQSGTAAGPERRVVIDMEQDVIEGRLAEPDQVLVVRPTARKFRSLIQVRADFRKEVLASGAKL